MLFSLSFKRKQEVILYLIYLEMLGILLLNQSTLYDPMECFLGLDFQGLGLLLRLQAWL